ncbi:ABC transporter permease subunit [Nocardioides sp. MAH-18]|uniref:ABC transporter permease subunit n=1 Tax=Nocardioides agri TaxID=2682843 RepID=A0A6L6XW45_9ACTN|nr:MULTISPECIES: amino acid ABC transporter permease [unclassified Nocardioides]MBA2955847.1 amino acid ABC transporter permease [Nocardioides sp. CGMCC 1.13656]MVQ50696.1 ABC transporter permease subunit [Nocardioides sp. MAH-18]
MSTVLFDTPGPRTRARHRLYTILTGVGLVALLAWFVWYLYEHGEFAYELWEPFVTPEYVEALWQGLLDTLAMAVLAILFAVVAGFLLGVGKLSEHRLLRWPSWLVVEFFRAVPLLLLIIFLRFGPLSLSPYWSVVVGLMLYNGAVLAEITRAGVLAVPRGQVEAAYALGMRKTQVMLAIQLPQAVKVMIPAIISQCIVALKDTSLGFYVLAPGLTTVGRSIWIEFGNQLQTALVLSAIYIVCNLILTAVAMWAQRRLVGERKPIVHPVDPGMGQGGPAPGSS